MTYQLALKAMKTMATHLNPSVDNWLTSSAMSIASQAGGIKPALDQLRDDIRHRPRHHHLTFTWRTKPGSGMLELLIGMPVVDQQGTTVAEAAAEVCWYSNVAELYLTHFSFVTTGADSSRPSTWRTRSMLSMTSDPDAKLDMRFSITPKILPEAAAWQAMNLFKDWSSLPLLFGPASKQDACTLYGMTQTILKQP